MSNDELNRRWNRAMSHWCAGSEFIDDPERCARQIESVIRFREGMAHAKGSKGIPLKNLTIKDKHNETSRKTLRHI